MKNISTLQKKNAGDAVHLNWNKSLDNFDIVKKLFQN